MLDYFGKLNRNVIDHIKYRGTMVTGEITVDNGDGTYDVKIAQSDKAYPNVETAFLGMAFSAGEVVLVTFEYGSKEMPRILGYAKRIVQHPVDVEVDESGEGGDPITTVKTLDAHSKFLDTIYLEGRISLSEGAGNCTRRGFQYGLTTDYGSDTHTDGSYGEGIFNLQLTELISGETYHFRAYVLDADGNEQVGEDRSFSLDIVIDIGNEAISRSSGLTSRTVVDKGNPANATGKIISIEIWAHTDIVNCKVATFFGVSGDNLSTRDYEILGNIADGEKRIFTVDINVQEGDYIGIYFESGLIFTDYSGGAGMWYTYSDNIPCTNIEFIWVDNFASSFYGKGF